MSTLQERSAAQRPQCGGTTSLFRFCFRWKGCDRLSPAKNRQKTAPDKSRSVGSSKVVLMKTAFFREAAGDLKPQSMEGTPRCRMLSGQGDIWQDWPS